MAKDINKTMGSIPEIIKLANGVWKIRVGSPEKFVPTYFQEENPNWQVINKLPDSDKLPFELKKIDIQVQPRGCVIEIPMGETEEIYGLGLGNKYLAQRGLRKQLVPGPGDNNGLGVSHAPVPFYVSTGGYGVFIDTARYAVFNVGTHLRRTNQSLESRKHNLATISEEELYRTKSQGNSAMYIEVPVAQGINIYVFSGPGIKEVVQRYNLFSGGGCVPPLWGLGMKYRAKSDITDKDVYQTIKLIRQAGIPCDMLGLEPGWQTHAYSSSYVWDTTRFPNPEEFIQNLKRENIHLNLWEQAYVDKSSPLHSSLKSISGDFEVWKGLVPDFADSKARKIFSDYHENSLIKQGVSGFKLDECDGDGNLQAFHNWSFPEYTQFPSGIDGEQMRTLLGILYQKTIFDIYKKDNKRTYGDVRASHALAAPYPFVLYSDEYSMKDFMSYMLSSGFHGLLWGPELRHSNSLNEFSMRLAMMTFSPLMNFNGWQIKYPPWLQPNIDLNNAGKLLEDPKPYETVVKQFTELRMSLIPYLYSAMMQYHYQGIPPVRALIMDYPNSPETRDISDQWMFGDSLMVAPLIPENSFESQIDLKAGDLSKWTTMGLGTNSSDTSQNQLLKDNKTSSCRINGDFSKAGLMGVKIPLQLKKSVPYILQFLYQGNSGKLGMRMWNVNKVPKDVGELYKDDLRCNSKDWMLFRKEFTVDEDGNYELYLGKGWFESVSSGEIIIKDLELTQKVLGKLEDRNSRLVYLPTGNWFNFWNHEKLEGGRYINAKSGIGHIPVYVKDGAILPLAKPVPYVSSDTPFEITCQVYSEHSTRFTLYEDDGISFDFKKGIQNRLELFWDGHKGTIDKHGGYRGSKKYDIVSWEDISK